MAWMIVYFVGGFLFLAFLMVAGLTDNPRLRSIADWWLLPSAILGFAATVVVMRWKRAKARREFYQHETEATRQAKAMEANSLTAELLKIRQVSLQLSAQMPQFLHDANASLQSVEEALKDNAPGPFWDAVQSSALHLARFCGSSQELAGRADRYYSALRGHRHTFPPFPFQPIALPNPMPLVEQLQSLVRRGLTNSLFATVWEQYKTHQIAVHEFSTLEQAINGLPVVAIGVTALLKNAISIDMDTSR